MAQQDDEDDQLLWLEEDDEQEVQEGESSAQLQGAAAAGDGAGHMEDRIRSLEAELTRSKKELQDVRRELAAKTVQLSKKEHANVVAVQEKAAEMAASASTEKERQLQLLSEQVLTLEMSLAGREEELEESRRLYNAQKKALREALNSVAEREAMERATDEANQFAQTQAVEDELDKLQYELVLTKKRAEVELKARDTALKQLKTELAEATANRQEAVANAEAALVEAYQLEMESMQTSSSEQVEELEAEIARLRTEMEALRRDDASTSLTGELAMLNNQKVQIQREFEVYKDMTIQAARDSREKVAALLSENAELHSRMAAKSLESVIPAGGSGESEKGVSQRHKMFDSLMSESRSMYQQGLDTYLPQLMTRIEQRRKGLLPFIIIGSLLFIFFLIAVIRAAVSTQRQHSGGLCFLAKLGISIGPGCGPSEISSAGKMVDIMDRPHRVHDVQLGNLIEEPGEEVEEMVEVAKVAAVNATAVAKLALRSGRKLANHLFSRMLQSVHLGNGGGQH